jgi:hypothetical protein
MDIVKLIAESIKKADSSYFFENYTKQAKSVLTELKRNGFVIVHKEPTKNMIKAGVMAINLGSVDARILAKNVYNDMIEEDLNEG